MLKKDKFTNWYPIYSYENHCNCYIVQCRKNLKTGYLYFDVTKIANDSFNIPLKINAEEQFNKVVSYKELNKTED